MTCNKGPQPKLNLESCGYAVYQQDPPVMDYCLQCYCYFPVLQPPLLNYCTFSINREQHASTDQY